MLDSEFLFATDCLDVHTEVRKFVGATLAENDLIFSIPNEDEQVCSTYAPDMIPMYEIIFRDMRFRLPFTDFQISVFNHFELAPRQLHPNSIAFIRVFELTCQYLGTGVTVSLLFYCFHIPRKTN